MPFSEIPGSEQFWECDLVLLSLGFLGPEHYVSDDLALDYDESSNYSTEYASYRCGDGRIFAAGDCRRGQSLVVWAINEGRGAAQEIDDCLRNEVALAVACFL